MFVCWEANVLTFGKWFDSLKARANDPTAIENDFNFQFAFTRPIPLPPFFLLLLNRITFSFS